MDQLLVLSIDVWLFQISSKFSNCNIINGNKRCSEYIVFIDSVAYSFISPIFIITNPSYYSINSCAYLVLCEVGEK